MKELNEGSNFGAVLVELGKMVDNGYYCLWLKMEEVACDRFGVRLHNARGLHSLTRKHKEGEKEYVGHLIHVDFGVEGEWGKLPLLSGMVNRDPNLDGNPPCAP